MTTETDTVTTDPGTPSAGTAWFYLVTAEGAEATPGASDGEEGTLGLGTSAERSNFAPCPVAP